MCLYSEYIWRDTGDPAGAGKGGSCPTTPALLMKRRNENIHPSSKSNFLQNPIPDTQRSAKTPATQQEHTKVGVSSSCLPTSVLLSEGHIFNFHSAHAMMP